MEDDLLSDAPLIGLVCEDADPVAQLIGGHLRSLGKGFVSGRDAQAISNVANRLIVTSQDIYLSDLALFSAIDLPVHLVARRCRHGETVEEWKTGLSLLKQSLDLENSPEVQLRALTQDAADEIGTFVGRVVDPLSPLPKVPQQSGVAVVEGPLMRFVKKSKTDSMPLSDVNWWRIRKKMAITSAPDASLDVQDTVGFASRKDGPECPTTKQTNAYLFVVSNGVGLGHLTRLLAVAKNLQGRVLFWSYSQAAQLIEEQGFPVIVRMTADHLDASLSLWNEWEAADLAGFVGQNSFETIVYDGSSPPEGLLNALVRPELGDTVFNWVRRGMWQVDADTSPLSKTHHCDLVIEPLDLASAVDIGPTKTVQPTYLGHCDFLQVAPVVATRAEDLLSRRKARSVLKHRSFRPLCLINLGGDSLSDHAPLMTLIERLAADEKIRFLWLRSPFSSGSSIRNGAIQQVRLFPIAPLLRAFDGIISASGYNSYHEVLTLSRAPVLFAPNRHARLDDQFARAAFAADQGWAQLFDPDKETSGEAQLKKFLDLVRKKAPSRDLVPIADGAAAIADAVSKTADGNSVTTDE